MIMRLNDVYDKEISGIIDGACSQYTYTVNRHNLSGESVST